MPEHEPLYTTIALARAAGACAEGLDWATAYVAERGGDDDTPVPLADILSHAPEADAFDWTLWALCAVPPEQEAARDRLARLYAADCVERALSLYEARYPDDGRPRAAIETARRVARGEATAEERAAARAAAWDAARAAWDAASAAAWAAWDAAWAAWAAWDAAGAASAAASAAAWAAAGAAAGDAERAWQRDRLAAYLNVEVNDA